MSWLGKILTVLVMLLTLVWMWFTVSVFVARTNWKNQAGEYKKGFDEAKTARETEYRAYQSEKDALARQLLAATAESRGKDERIAALEDANKKNIAQVAALDQAIKNQNLQKVQEQATFKAALDEQDKLRARNKVLEDDRVALVIAKETAEKNRQAAENARRQAEADKLLADRRVEELTTQLTDSRTPGGSGGTGLRNFEKPPAQVPEGLRGTVTAAQEGYVVISVGLDAGLTPGATLDVYRSGEGARYLGTVVIDRVYPKQAVAVFKPADPKRTVRQLRPEELPKVGDTIGRIGSIGTTP